MVIQKFHIFRSRTCQKVALNFKVTDEITRSHKLYIFFIFINVYNNNYRNILLRLQRGSDEYLTDTGYNEMLLLLYCCFTSTVNC